MRATRNTLAKQALFHRAVGSDHRKRGDELRHHRTAPRGEQQLREMPRADALVVREPGTVLERELRRIDFLALDPFLDRAGGFLAARGRPAELGPERKEELARHHVVR